MNFVFISPNFPAAYERFCIGLHENGVNVLGIGDAPYGELSEDLRYALTEYYRVDDMKDYDQMVRAMGLLTAHHGKIDWVESNNEFWMELDAALRTDFNIVTGLKSDQIMRYRSKTAMKKYYKKAGIPTARYSQVVDLETAQKFIAEVGYPVIVKPDRGVGALATWRLENDEDLKLFFHQIPEIPYVMEEYITGVVETYDGVINSKGEVLFAASHISPNSIMDMVNEGVPTYYYVNKQVAPDIEDAGKRVLKAFDVRSRFFHLEFFRLTKDKPGIGKTGDVVGLEVNMRPAGGFTPDMLNYSQSVDVFRIWADMIAFDENRHVYSGPQRYCVYCGRRDEIPYTHTLEEIGTEYGANLAMMTRMPDALAGTMGNQVCIACFDTLSQVNSFVRYAFIPQKHIPPESSL